MPKLFERIGQMCVSIDQDGNDYFPEIQISQQRLPLPVTDSYSSAAVVICDALVLKINKHAEPSKFGQVAFTLEEDGKIILRLGYHDPESLNFGNKETNLNNLAQRLSEYYYHAIWR